jgi:hypothetical protein
VRSAGPAQGDELKPRPFLNESRLELGKPLASVCGTPVECLGEPLAVCGGPYSAGAESRSFAEPFSQGKVLSMKRTGCRGEGDGFQEDRPKHEVTDDNPTSSRVPPAGRRENRTVGGDRGIGFEVVELQASLGLGAAYRGPVRSAPLGWAEEGARKNR